MSGATELLIVSESLLASGILPQDFLNSGRFELRAAQDLAEMISLAENAEARAVFLDVTAVNGDFNSMLAQLRGIFAAQRRNVPVLGFLMDPTPRDLEAFFLAGVNLVFQAPFETQNLYAQLQNFLGVTFRRHERKTIHLPIKISWDNDEWSVIGRSINADCVLVTGRELPAEGMNVYLESSKPEILNLGLWAYCWQERDGGLLLRFLNPSPQLLQAIQALPAEPPKKRPDEAAATAAVQSKPYLSQPEKLSVIDLADAAKTMSLWASGQQPAAAPWRDTFDKMSTFDLEALRKLKDKPAPAFAVTLKHLLAAQLRSSELAMDRDAKKIIDGHARLVRQVSTELQVEITQAMAAKHQNYFEGLSQLKSNLLRSMAGLQAWTKTLAPDTGNASAERAETSSTINVRLNAWVAQALLTILILGCLYVAYLQWAPGRRNFRELSDADAKSISNYVERVVRVRAEGQVNLTLWLVPAWNHLSPEAKQKEADAMAAHLRALQVTQAEFFTAGRGRLPSFRNGQFVAPLPVATPLPIKAVPAPAASVEINHKAAGT